MTFEQLVTIVQRWQRRMTPTQLSQATTWIGDDIIDWPEEIPVTVDAVLALAAARDPMSIPEPLPRARYRKPPGAERARRLLRQQLANGPKPESQIEAAAISERSLIAAAEALEIRTQRGQWWLPGQGALHAL